MSEPMLSEANQAARELREQLKAPPWALNVTAWVQGGRTSLMVWVDPKFAGKVKIPSSFHKFRVGWRRKMPIKAQSE
jgi:hypothetical protein